MTFNFSLKPASLGVFADIERRVQQTRPAVVECDETVLALERRVATDIVVAAYEDPLSEAAE